MTAYNASNIPKLASGQTYFWNQTQGKFVGNTLGGIYFNYAIDHNQFNISTRNCFLNTYRVTEADNPVSLTPGNCFVAAAVSTLNPVHFVLPSAGPGLVHGDCIKIAGFGFGRFDVTAVAPQTIDFGTHPYHVLTSLQQFDQISFMYNKFGINDFWEVFGVQGNFGATP